MPLKQKAAYSPLHNIYKVICISKKETSSMPSGSAGLVRYFDDYKESIVFKPEHVLVFITIIIVVELVLKHLAV